LVLSPFQNGPFGVLKSQYASGSTCHGISDLQFNNYTAGKMLSTLALFLLSLYSSYSRRKIQLLPVMKAALMEQLSICEKLDGEYLFCTTTGEQLNHANLSNRVWRPALKEAGIPYRPMIQTRHSFATTALSLGEWIAHIMGHRDTDMIIKVYTKYLKNAVKKLSITS